MERAARSAALPCLLRIVAGTMLLPLTVTGCADPPPEAAAAPASETFEPAPLPGARYVRPQQGPIAVSGPMQIRMPPGTGAVPVSASPVRGTVTGNLLTESF